MKELPGALAADAGIDQAAEHDARHDRREDEDDIHDTAHIDSIAEKLKGRSYENLPIQDDHEIELDSNTR